LSGVTLFAVHGARSAFPQVNTALTWLAALMVAGAIMGAHFLAFRRGLQKAESDLVFVLTDEDLIRRKSGCPDVRILLSAITALYERRGWLVVESAEPPTRIAIPDRVDGFKSLRAELTKHSRIIAAPPRPSLLRIIPTVGYIVSWSFVLWSRNASVAGVAGIVGLILLGWESFRAYELPRHSPKRIAIWCLLGLGWVGVALIIYFRIARS
jgi:hypothetical protein